MKRLIAGVLALGSAGMMGWAAPEAEYINKGRTTETPQINARKFINQGVFDVAAGSKPFETQNTEVFLNTGLISVNPGMRFELLDDAGFRRPATLFSNAPTATVMAIDGTALINGLNSFQTPGGTINLGQLISFLAAFNTLNPYRSVTDSFLTVNADEIINRGAIIGTAGGEVRLEGNKVDLSRSAVDILPLADARNNFGLDISSTPLPGQVDDYWHYDQTRVVYGSLLDAQVQTNVVLGVTNVATTILAAGTPSFPVSTVNTPPGGPFPRQSLSFPRGLGDSIVPFVWITTNPPAGFGPTNPATNQIITVLLVRRPTTNILVDATITPGFDPFNAPLPTVRLRLVSMSSNVITGKSDATVLRLDNTFGSDPNPLLMSNRLAGNTYMPTNFVFSRSTILSVPNPLSPLVTGDTNLYQAALNQLYARLQLPGLQRLPGAPPTAEIRGDLLTAWGGGGITNALKYTNNAATNPYVAYGASFGFQATTVPSTPAVPASSTTNLSGRIVIGAKDLDLRRVRMRTQGPILIRAENLVSSAGAVIDSPYIDANLGSSSGKLDLSGLFRSQVERFSGTVQVFSTLWTNTVDYMFTVTNAPVNPTDPPTTTDTTVGLQSIFHYMYVDADLLPIVQVPFVNLKLKATNVVLGDVFKVNSLTAVSSETLTLNGQLQISGIDNGNFDWDAASFKNLRRFTNNGSLFVQNHLTMGSDRSVGYEVVNNNGFAFANSVSITSDLVQTKAGSIFRSSSGPFEITGRRAEIEGNIVARQNNFVLSVDEAKFAGAGLGGVDTLFVDLQVKNRIEAGSSVMSFFNRLGLKLASMPPSVNLTNVSIDVLAPDFQEAVITWPGEDKGPTASAFDGHQIAQLLLDGGLLSTITFAPIGDKAALYAGFVSLSTNLVSTNLITGKLVLGDLNVLPGMTVYFASANVPGKQLELASGGRFIQVPGVGGFPAGVPTTVNGRMVPVARALRYAMNIDSDGDGIVNGLDENPFDGVVVKNARILEDGLPGFRITWEAAPGQTYEVQSTSDTSFGEWKQVERVTNPSIKNQTLWFRDPIPAGDGGRAYRVIYQYQ